MTAVQITFVFLCVVHCEALEHCRLDGGLRTRLHTITRITVLAFTMGAKGSTSRHGDSEKSRSVCAKVFTCCSAIQPIYDVDDDASSHTAQRSMFVGV